MDTIDLRSRNGYGRTDEHAVRYVKQRVFLLRHGETQWSLSRQHTGLTDVALTENGRATARRLAPVLARQVFDLVLVSPLRRARETCELAGLGAQAKTDEDLVEWNYGEYEGLTPQQIRAKAPDWLIFNDGCPGGETPAHLDTRINRVIACVQRLEGNVALFAHGHVLRAMAARWLGLPIAAGAYFLLDTATLSVLSYYHGIGAIERWNDAIDT
jgi:broad specificity phosphatase PhoE